MRNLCNGGCPKDRFGVSRDGEAGQNYLCEGLELFFMHTGPMMSLMAQLLQKRRAPSEIMEIVKDRDAERTHNAPCPCGSGNKFRKCHGDRNPETPFSKLDLATAGAAVGTTLQMGDS